MPERTRRTSAAPPRALVNLAAYALVTLVVLGAATATPWRVDVPSFVLPEGPTDLPTQAPAPLPAGPPPDQQTPEALTVVVIVWAILGGLLVLTLLYLLARRMLAALRDTRDDEDDPLPGAPAVPGSPAGAIPLTELQDAVRSALARVDAAATPHDAVVAAWVALEDAAATHGHTRDPAQTPTEFTGELLAATPAPRGDVRTLCRLYSEARFTDRPVTPAQVVAARDALQGIAGALSRGPSPQDAP